MAILTAFILTLGFYTTSTLPERTEVLGKETKPVKSVANKELSQREKQALRSRLRNIKELPNGQTKAELFEKPVQFQTETGQWKDINTELKTKVSGREVVAKNLRKITSETLYANENLIKSTFSSSVAGKLNMQFDGGGITNEYLGATPSIAKMIGASDVLYENAYGNKVDIERKILPGEVKQNIILKEKGHPRVFQEKIDTTLRVELQKDNSINYYQGDELMAQTPPIYIVDMNGVRMDVALKYENKILTITLPSRGLRRLTYPLVIDPSTTVYNAANDDGYVFKSLDGYGAPGYLTYLNSANLSASGVNSDCTAPYSACQRSFLRFPLAGLGTITSATLKTYGYSGTSNGVLYHSAPYDLSTDSGATLWNKAVDSQQAFTSIASTLSDHTVTTSVAADYNAGRSYTYFAIYAGAGGAAVYTYAQDNTGTTYDPRLDVTFTSVPVVPTNPGGTAQSTSAIRWTWTDASSDETGFKVQDSSHVDKCTTGANTSSCDESSLTTNTAYTRHIHANNANGDSAPTADVTKYTLAAAPNVTADKTDSTWYNTPTVTFTNAAGFGAGGVTKYKYVWNQTATHAFSGDGTDWSSSTLPLTMTAGNTNYLHVQSYNGDNVAGSAANYGPFYYDAAAPTGTTLDWGIIGTTTINLTASGATDALSGLRGDSLTYYIERDNGATAFATADANSGWISGAWNQTSLSVNTAYAYRVKARDNVGNESGWITPTPVYKYTNVNTPASASSTANPTNPTTAIDVSWTAGAGGATRYYVRSSSDNYATLTDLVQDSYTESSLSPSTTYTYRIWAVNADLVESASYATTTAITATGVPSNLNSTANSTSQITVTWSAPPGGSNHYHLYRDGSQVGGNITGTSAVDSGLNANTQYTYFVKAVSVSEVEGVASADITRYTLAVSPDVTFDKATFSWYNTSAVTFTNSAGFGSGGVTKYKYVWDQQPSYSFVGDGLDWSASTLNRTMISGNNNYLHVQSYNGDNVAGSTANYGPFYYDNAGPTGTISIDEGDYFKNGNSDNTLHLTLSATDTQSGVDRMQFSKDGIVWCTPVSYTTNATYILGASPSCDPTDTLEGEKNVYVRYVDVLGNTGSIYSDMTMLDITAPNNSTTIVGPDVSSAWGNNGTPQFSWSGATDDINPPTPYSGLKGYYVYFGTNALGEPKTATHAGNLAYVDNGNSNLYYTNAYTVSSALVSGRIYYLKVRAFDNATNDASANYVESSNKFVYKFDNTNPDAPSNIEVTPPQPTTVDSYGFSWDTPQDNPTAPNAGVRKYLYRRDNGLDNWSDNGAATSVTNITKYKAGANKFSIKAVDWAGNESQIVQATYYYSDPAAVTVQNLAVDEAQSQTGKINSYKFTWDGIAGASRYYFASNASPTENSDYFSVGSLPVDTTISVGSNNNVRLVINTDGDVQLGYYASATQMGLNYFRVVAVDMAGSANWGAPASVAYTINTDAPSAPSSITITDASNRSASMYALTVMWPPVSNPNSNFDGYVVEKSTDGTIFTRVATVKTYIYSEAGLTEGQRYYYRIRSIDNTGNTSSSFASGDRVPTGKYTVPPTITDNPVAEVKATSVNITWHTNRASNSIVQFGPGNGYGQEISSATNYVFDHSIDLNGLTPGVTYHFRVASIDKDYDYSESSAFSNDFIFTTLQAPGISNVTTSEIRLYSAIVTWKTTSSATSRILYGTTTAYGKTYEDNSGSQTTTHTVKLTNLTDATNYHYKIQGLDVDGNILTSDDYVFETLTFPKISNLKLSQVPNTPTSTVKVGFDSNVPTSSMVTFSGSRGKEVAKYELETTHVIQVTGLADDTAYTVTVKGRDQYGNETLPSSTSYKTDFDTRPPFITNITVETSIVGYGVDAKGQLVISWTTDEPSTSQVEYGTGVGGVEYSSRTQEDTSLTENHVVIISDLKPSSPYHFRVVSSDSAGNTGKSADNSVLTEEASQSVIDLIIKSLQSSIGWIFSAFGGAK